MIDGQWLMAYERKVFFVRERSPFTNHEPLTISHVPATVLLALLSVLVLDAGAFSGEPPKKERSRTVAGIHVWTDRSADCFSRKALLRSLVKPGMTDEEKAVAFWRLVNRRIYHFPRADDNDPMRVLNVYGYSLCGTIQHVLVWLAQGEWGRAGGGRAGLSSRPFDTEEERRIMGAGWLLDSFVRLDGIKAPGKMGHTWCQLFYDGRRHFLDAHAGMYVYTADGRNIASVEEISGDPTLVSDPVKKSDPFMPCDGGRPEFFYRCAGGGQGGTLEKTPHSMELRVRPGETLVFHFDKLPGAYFKRSFSWAKQWAPKFYKEGPHHRCAGGKEKPYRHYGNGEIIYRPDLAKRGFREALAESRNLACRADDGKPGLHAKDAGGGASATFAFKTPYVMVGGEVAAEFELPKGATARVTLLAPGRRRAKPQTVLTVRGDGGRRKAAGRMDMRALVYPYEAHLKVELSGGALVDLEMRIITQLNFHALPRPLAGKNKVFVESATGDPRAAGLAVEWAWTEAGGKGKSDRRPVAGRKFSYDLELGKTDARPAENPKYMRWLKLEVPEK